MGYLRNVKTQYWISFFHALIPAYVIERLFWQQRGMGVQMVVYAEIIYACTVTAFEVPSGILSDRFGRKRLLLLSSVLSALEMLLLLFAHHFWQFAAVVFLAGVGRALSSGSENALLYDSLAEEGRQNEFERLLGRLSAVSLTGSLTAALGGGVLANLFGYEFNYVFSLCSMSITVILTLTLRETPLRTMPGQGMAAGTAQYVKEALSFFRAQPLVVLYCASGAVLGACMIYLDEFWQIIAKTIGIPVVYFGAISAMLMLIRIPGSLLAFWLKKRFGYDRVLSYAIGASVASYAAVFLARNALCILPMLLAGLVVGIVEPLIAGYLHHHVDDAIRATVESFSSLALRAVSAGVGLLFGYVGAAYSVFAGFLALSAVTLAYGLWFGAHAGKRIRSKCP